MSKPLLNTGKVVRLHMPVPEPVTMTSVEIVGYINETRKAVATDAGAAFPSKGHAKLEHSDFMKKVVEVLGSNAGNFSDIYVDRRGRKQACYRFPKREACLMAMSYSYELQAQVFDKMTAMETAQYAAPRIQYVAQPQDSLTAAEQRELRDMLTDAVERLPKEQQGGAMQKGWSRLKAHFKCSYRDIPRSEFTEALGIMARHIAEFDALPAPARVQAIAAPTRQEEQLQLALGGIASLTSSVASLAATVASLTEKTPRR